MRHPTHDDLDRASTAQRSTRCAAQPSGRENPLHAAPADLEHIAVVETFSRGRSVFAQPRVD